MRSTALVLLVCLGLLTAACDGKRKPGIPVPKASVSVVVSALSVG
ncbi:hypothetical protein [Acidovorax cavernicola]|nr:hypothetical protein [Acidovorax cavernicola]